MVQTSQNTAMPVEDRYSDDIDFSNACREFYINRKQVTEDFKEQVDKREQQKSMEQRDKPASFMETAMDKLRKEMATLMDQDLSLMKQLLTLNETIEEIKFKRRHGGSKDFDRSSRYLSDSKDDCSTSDLRLDLPRIKVTDTETQYPYAVKDGSHYGHLESMSMMVQGQISTDSGYDESSSSSDESSSDYETTV